MKRRVVGSWVDSYSEHGTGYDATGAGRGVNQVLKARKDLCKELRNASQEVDMATQRQQGLSSGLQCPLLLNDVCSAILLQEGGEQ